MNVILANFKIAFRQYMCISLARDRNLIILDVYRAYMNGIQPL